MTTPEPKDMQPDTSDWTRRWVGSTRDYSVFLITPEGRVASWNEGGIRTEGYQPQEILGQHFSVLYTDKDRRDGFPDAVMDSVRQTGCHDSEGWRRRKDGSTFWASVDTTALRDDRGLFDGAVQVVRDVSEKRRANEAVLESEQRFRFPAAGARGDRLRHLHALARRVCDELEQRRPADQGLQRRRDCRFAFLTVLYAGRRRCGLTPARP